MDDKNKLPTQLDTCWRCNEPVYDSQIVTYGPTDGRYTHLNCPSAATSVTVTAGAVDPHNTADYWRGQKMQRDSVVDNLRASLEKMVDTVLWMSGSNDFGPEGQAWEGWQKVQPDIDKANALLKNTAGDGR